MLVHGCSHSDSILLFVPWDPGSLCKCKYTSVTLLSCVALAWCLLIVTNGRASSDWSLGPMLVCVRLGDICVDEHGCRSQHVSNSNSTSVKHLSLLPSTTALSQPTLPRSIHHLSSITHHQWQLPISSLLNYRLDFPDIQ